MTLLAKYFSEKSAKLKNLLETSTTRLSSVFKPLTSIRDIADLTIDCAECGEATASVDCHEVEEVYGYDQIKIIPVCPSCLTQDCLQLNEAHYLKHHKN